MTFHTERLRTMEQVRAFVEGSEPVAYQPEDRRSAYEFVRRTLVRFDYPLLGRADRGCGGRAYIGKACGFSPTQISRLIRQRAETGVVADRRARNSGRAFETRYTLADIRLLAEVDEAFGGMSALATCEILRRARDIHGDARFERLANQAHDLGEDAPQPSGHRRAQGTRAERPAGLSAGRHRPHGRQGRTQGCVRRQRRRRGDAVRARRRGAGHLGAVHGSDPGSATASVPVRRDGLPRRQRLRVHQPPRRRATEQAARRRAHEIAAPASNDNALVEGKNAHVVRKHLGHEPSPCASPNLEHQHPIVLLATRVALARIGKRRVQRSRNPYPAHRLG